MPCRRMAGYRDDGVLFAGLLKLFKSPVRARQTRMSYDPYKNTAVNVIDSGLFLLGNASYNVELYTLVKYSVAGIIYLNHHSGHFQMTELFGVLIAHLS